jgi:hypothetical protein
MNELVQISAPGWANILLIALSVIIVISVFGFAFAAFAFNGKLVQISLNIAGVSMLSLLGLTMMFVLVGGFVIENPNAYTITKTDDTILVNSKSDWIANSTYNILEHKNGIYYLYDSEHPKNLVKISDDELKQMMSKD